MHDNRNSRTSVTTKGAQFYGIFTKEIIPVEYGCPGKEGKKANWYHPGCAQVSCENTSGHALRT